MAKSAKKVIAFGIVLTALGVIMATVGGVVKAIQVAEYDNYYNNYFGGYGASSQKQTSSATTGTYILSLGSGTSIPSNTTRTYTITVSSGQYYSFNNNSSYALYVTIKSSSGATVVSRRSIADYYSFYTTYSSLKVTVENNSYSSASFYIGY